MLCRKNKLRVHGTDIACSLCKAETDDIACSLSKAQQMLINGMSDVYVVYMSLSVYPIKKSPKNKHSAWQNCFWLKRRNDSQRKLDTDQ